MSDGGAQEDERPGYVKIGAYWVPIDPLCITCCGAPDPGVCHRFGICRMDGSHPSITARPSADTETLRPVLLAHHPIMRSEDGPLSGCRCGQVRLGADVIAHVAEQVLSAMNGEPNP